MLPDTITLYRLPLLNEAQLLLEEHRADSFTEAVCLAVRETIWHEVGHYFGLPEEAVHAREAIGTNHFEEESPSSRARVVPEARGRAPRQPHPVALGFGVIFILLGMAGFTSNPLIGHNALFAAGTAYDLLHLCAGFALVLAAYTRPRVSDAWQKLIGAFFILVGVIGLLTVSAAGGLLMGLAYANGASDWLNLILGALAFFGSAIEVDRQKNVLTEGEDA